VIKTFGRKWRAQDPNRVIEEIQHQMDVMKTRSVFFVDDNFSLDRNRAKQILRGIIRECLDIDIITQVRAEAARDEELLELMQEAGVFYVAVGFESVNPNSLRAYKKGLNVEETFQSIALFHKYGIRVHGMFVVGCDEDDAETIRKTVDYSIQYNLDSVHYLAIMPLPGTELTRAMEENGVIFSYNYDLYNSHYVTYYPKKMRPSTLQKEVTLAHRRFYSYGNILRTLWRGKGLNHVKFMLIGHFLNAKLNKQQFVYQEKLEQMEESLSGHGKSLLLSQEVPFHNKWQMNG